MMKFKLPIGNFFQQLRKVPKMVFEKFAGRLEIKVDQELLAKVLEILAETPGEPVSPFRFGTDKSLRFWFWLITQYPNLTDGSHWLRTGDIESAWQTEVTFGEMRATIMVFNTRPDAKYVYGPWAVAGHIATGWPDQWMKAKAFIYAEMDNVVVETFDEAIYEAAKEAGL